MKGLMMTVQRSNRQQTRRQHAIVNGYRSGLEEKVGEQLLASGLPFSYESIKLRYLQPEKMRSYTPDFPIADGFIIIESKGRFLTDDRQKHLLVKAQHPNLDIRFVFDNPWTRINKGSKTTYADWCDKHGFKWAAKLVPEEWLDEVRRMLRK